jgi:ABC-2 type transport system ATP-binding protein
VITARGLTKRYGEVTALDRLDLDIERGEVFGLIGPNGAGKTSFMRCAVGASRPSNGRIRVLTLDPITDRWELRNRVGYMPQRPALYLDLSTRRNVAFFAAAHHRVRDDSDIDRTLDLVGLSDRADDPVRTLSGGMVQRVSLACAMTHEPEILILDEPTAGIDPELRAAFWDHFRHMAEDGTTLIVSTHQMGEALECDRVALLRAGEILAVEEPTRLLRSTKATVTLWRDGEQQTVVLEDYPHELPGLLKDGVERVEVELEPLDDIVLELMKGE